MYFFCDYKLLLLQPSLINCYNGCESSRFKGSVRDFPKGWQAKSRTEHDEVFMSEPIYRFINHSRKKSGSELLNFSVLSHYLFPLFHI